MGRLSPSGAFPHCPGCNSLERHRALRNVFDLIPDSWFANGNVLQISDDPAVPRDKFKSVEVSVFGGKNSLDIQNIDRSDNTYDWIICNHVLEHVPNDSKAMKELLRVLKSDGIIQFAIPDVLNYSHTVDWGFPDANQHGHFRIYGTDWMSRFSEAFQDSHFIFETKAKDPVTGLEDLFFFVVKDPEKISFFEKNQTFKSCQKKSVQTFSKG